MERRTVWMVGLGIVAVAVVWWLARRGSGAQILSPQSGPTGAQLEASSAGFGALAQAASAELQAQAQLEAIRAEAQAYLQGQALQAQATEAAADRMASAQRGAYVWGTIRDIGVTLIPYVFGRRAPPAVGGTGGMPGPAVPVGTWSL